MSRLSFEQRIAHLAPDVQEYCRQQLAWAEQVKLKDGDKVLVMSAFENHQGGCRQTWEKDDEEFVGQEVIVAWHGRHEEEPHMGLCLRRPEDNSWATVFPFYCLLKVED